LTKAELAIAAEGFTTAQRRLMDREIAQAWHTANLTRAKRLPSLRRLLQPKPKKVEPAVARAALEEAERAIAEEEARARG
jgi:hypothetical protein